MKWGRRQGGRGRQGRRRREQGDGNRQRQRLRMRIVASGVRSDLCLHKCVVRGGAGRPVWRGVSPSFRRPVAAHEPVRP